MTETRELGVDAAGKFDWVGVIVDEGGFVGAETGSLQELIRWAEPVAVIGVDIPIGNLASGARGAEAAARAILGSRRSSVFNALPLEATTHDDYATLNVHLSELGRPKMSRQSWALRSKAIEATALAKLDERIIEVHPEVSFRALAGHEVDSPKKSWNGQLLRRRLLSEAGIDLPDDLGAIGRVASDDILDAAAAAWSARRFALGEAVPLPAHEETDPAGRRLAIWF